MLVHDNFEYMPSPQESARMRYAESVRLGALTLLERSGETDVLGLRTHIWVDRAAGQTCDLTNLFGTILLTRTDNATGDPVSQVTFARTGLGTLSAELIPNPEVPNTQRTALLVAGTLISNQLENPYRPTKDTKDPAVTTGAFAEFYQQHSGQPHHSAHQQPEGV